MRALRAVLTAGLAIAAMLPAQAATSNDPTIELAIAPASLRGDLPALLWLCSSALPARNEWPDGLQPDDSIVVRLSPNGLAIEKNRVLLPRNAALIGSVEWPSGPRILCACTATGSEDWYVPCETRLAPEWHELLDRLRAGETGRTRTIDLPVAVGHLLGANALGDPDREPVQFGAALCGEVTWRSWWTADHLRIRARSSGGLLLPATLLALAKRLGNGSVAALPMRAFTARDGDREEAVRQLSRSGALDDRDVLQAMLHGPDELRLTAIDSLVRLSAFDALPAIVDAAAVEMPLASVAAVDAVATLWPRAPETTRDATRVALDRSEVDALRELGGATPTTGAPRPNQLVSASNGIGEPFIVRRWRLMLGLFVVFVLMFGLWLRERARAAIFA